MFDIRQPNGTQLRPDVATVNSDGYTICYDTSVASLSSNSAIPQPSSTNTAAVIVETIVTKHHRSQIARYKAKEHKYKAAVEQAGHQFQPIIMSQRGVMDAKTAAYVRGLFGEDDEERRMRLGVDRPHSWGSLRHMLALMQVGLLRGVADAIPRRHRSLLRKLAQQAMPPPI